jgi:hypothetical protein
MESKLALIRFLNAGSSATDDNVLRVLSKKVAARTLPKSKGTVAAALRLAMRNASFSEAVEKATAVVLHGLGTSTRRYPVRIAAGLAWDAHSNWSGELGLQWMLEDYARVVFHERKRQKGGLMQVVATLDNLDSNAERLERLKHPENHIEDDDQRNRLIAALRDIAQPSVLLVATILSSSSSFSTTVKAARDARGARGGKATEVVDVDDAKTISSAESIYIPEEEAEREEKQVEKTTGKIDLEASEDDDDDDGEDVDSVDTILLRAGEARDGEVRDRDDRDDRLQRIVQEANRARQSANSLRQRYRSLLSSSSR